MICFAQEEVVYLPIFSIIYGAQIGMQLMQHYSAKYPTTLLCQIPYKYLLSVLLLLNAFSYAFSLVGFSIFFALQLINVNRNVAPSPPLSPFSGASVSVASVEWATSPPLPSLCLSPPPRPFYMLSHLL